MIKGEKYRLNLEGSTEFVLVYVLSAKLDCPVLQTGLFGFAQHNFLSIFLFPNSSGLEKYVMCERLC
jgi:hypothetical protein